MNEIDLEKKIAEIQSLVDAYGETVQLLTNNVAYLSEKVVGLGDQVISLGNAVININQLLIRHEERFDLILDGLKKVSGVRDGFSRF